ncbi:zinc finger CCHC domain-containing protein 14 [Conger conger]|uniref:zinc finger CCHC domain-containing protein 14 n=1 Tax=Conger conger TaxID=82655 RepID=UPI002A5AE1F2|nr:zinc finger CCHC domain-containing protein 14 [Conger conger]
MVEKRCTVQREGVYRWFSQLNSAQRAEFLCGLLDLCVPIELRFLGSCLEDLARKDYHSLRDAEIKANNPADLANLTNITDEVVRSKLLISLALLNSDNREAAGVLFRTLTHIDSIINNYGLQLNDGQTGDQFLLLFTMASNHPAFSFHQKQVLRQGLVQIQGILQTTCGEHHSGVSSGALATLTSANTVTTYITAATLNSCYAGCTSCHTVTPQEDGAGRGDEGSGIDAFAPLPAHSCQELPLKVHAGNSSKVNIERIDLKGFVPKSDKPSEYSFEVLWSDSGTSSVTRSAQEVTEFLSKISQLVPDDSLEKLLPPSTGPDSALEPDPRCLTTLPPHLLKRDQIRQFFSVAPVTMPPPSANLACSLQYRGANSLPRPICGVASIQPVISGHCSLQPYPATALLPPGAAPVLPLGGGVMCEGAPSQTSGRSPAPQPQAGPEQSGILDWLRKLRLHKYYPVFKQLTMEKFLALTEEDLNKYDLTQGAKKKLKTQLELQNREKKYVVSHFPVSCSGVARVMPSSHISPVTPIHSSTELRVEVETGPHLFPRDSSSSSGYCSSPTSPMTPLSRDDGFDRARDPHRRLESSSDAGEKDRSCVLLNHTVPTGPCRPTAQVLPVQNDPSPYHLPQLSATRILSSPRKPRPPPPPPPTPVLSPLCPPSDERVKPLRLEGRFPGLSMEVAPPLQDGSGPTHQGPLAMLLSPPGPTVETSVALTATSNTLHHVTHPPLQLQLSPSIPPDHAHRYAHPRPGAFPPSVSGVPMATVSSVPMATVCSISATSAGGGSIPMATVPGNTYCASGGTAVSGLNPAPPTSSPGPAPGADAASVCVCSSCGCSGNCGSYSALPAGYAGYFQHPFSGPPVFTLGPLLHLSPLLAPGPHHPQQHSGSAAPFSYPLVAPPLYSGGLPQETQPSFVLPPMQGFLGGGAGVYQPQGMLGNGGVGHKKAGNMSCYNCGVSGHRAQDCKQPPMDSAQQGTFRLKYAPPSDGQDSGD